MGPLASSVGQWMSRLTLQNYEKLLNLPPLLFDGSCLLLFDVVMQLEFLLGLCRLADPIVGHTSR